VIIAGVVVDAPRVGPLLSFSQFLYIATTTPTTCKSEKRVMPPTVTQAKYPGPRELMMQEIDSEEVGLEMERSVESMFVVKGPRREN
jgi:hypothetical protein